MKTKMICLSLCACLAAACSTETTESTQRDLEWAAVTDGKLSVEMNILGYSHANLEANIDEFYRLNPRYFRKVGSNANESTDSNSGWRTIKSSTSGIVYEYSFTAGDIIALPVHSLRSYAMKQRKQAD